MATSSTALPLNPFAITSISLFSQALQHSVLTTNSRTLRYKATISKLRRDCQSILVSASKNLINYMIVG